MNLSETSILCQNEFVNNLLSRQSQLLLIVVECRADYSHHTQPSLRVPATVHSVNHHCLLLIVRFNINT